MFALSRPLSVLRPARSVPTARSCRVFGAALAVVLSSTGYSAAQPTQPAAPPSAPPPAAAPLDRPSSMALEDQATTKGKALTLYRQALKEQDAGHWQASRDLYAEAWELDANFDTAASLGLSELKLKRFGQAAYYLEYALTHLPVTQKERLEQTLQDSLRQARRHTARLTWSVTPASAVVTLNGGPATQPLFLVPGRYRLRASAERFIPEEKNVVVDQPDERTLTFELTPEAQPEPELTRAGRPEVLWFGGSLTGLLLVSGLGFQAAGAAALNDLTDEPNTALCYMKNTPECRDRKTRTDSASDKQRVGTGLIIGAGAAAVGTLVTYLLWRQDAPLQLEGSTHHIELGWKHAF